ncbi:hypothetical protein [Nocardia sp. NPDC051463]|uniref:hypothetical protein n=1 Tax=Nocardia sp. NPDC051463 TaxID=3154845 RepID=UPI00344F6CB4
MGPRRRDSRNPRAYTTGPARDWAVVWVIDVITGTGMRPHEVFALLLDDIDPEAADPYLDVTGTLVEEKGKGTGGWVCKPATTGGAGPSCPRTPSSGSTRPSST